MKTATAGLITHLGESNTKLATCWKIKRRDGTSFNFTDHDLSLSIDIGDGDGAQTYEPADSYIRSAVSTRSTMNVDDMESEGVISSTAITENDLRAGLFNGARVWLFAVRWDNLAQGIIKLRKGWLGEVSVAENTYKAELRGLTQLLQQGIVDLVSLTCRAQFGDSDCTATPQTFTGTIDSISETDRVFTVSGLSGLKADLKVYRYGTVSFNTGANNSGLSFEVLDFQDQATSPDTYRISLFIPATYTVEVGDSVTLTEGCTKFVETCRDSHNNIVNFRGEPYAPNEDEIYRIRT